MERGRTVGGDTEALRLVVVLNKIDGDANVVELVAAVTRRLDVARDRLPRDDLEQVDERKAIAKNMMREIRLKAWRGMKGEA